MILDKLGEINIKDLAIKEPVFIPEIPYNPRRDTTPQEWELIKEKLSYLLRDDTQGNLMQMVKDIALVFPDRLGEMDKDGRIRDRVEIGILENKKGQSVWTFTEAALGLKLLNLNSQFDIDGRGWDFIKSEAESEPRKNLSFFELAAAAKMIYPERELDFVEPADLEILVQELSEDRYQIRRVPLFALSVRAAGRILFPESDQFRFTKLEWNELIAMITDDKKSGHWSTYLNFSSSIITLIAQEIEITSKGIKFILPGEKEDFNQTEFPMPKRRNF